VAMLVMEAAASILAGLVMGYARKQTNFSDHPEALSQWP